MTDPTQFQCHPDSTLLTPEAAGLVQIVQAIAQRDTIVARQSPGAPITRITSRAQWLECQTSGSTGIPKTIRRRPASWIKSFEISKDSFGVGPRDTYAVLGAIGYSLSLYAALEALHIGADLCALGGVHPSAQLGQMTCHNVTVLYATPTQVSQLLTAALRKGDTTLDHLSRVFIGGGTLDRALAEKLARLAPNASIVQFYGTSETSFISMTDAITPTGSVGRAYRGVDLRCGTPDTPAPVRVRSPFLFEGYADAETQFDLDGYVPTGEVGYLDAQGYLFLCGRVDRMVTINDVNVFPEAIENAVLSMDRVASCVALTVPDAVRGHQVICCVVGTAPEADIRDLCRARLGKAFVPRQIRNIPELPLLPSGKPDLRALQKLVAKPV